VETTSHNSKKKPRSNGFYNVNDILWIDVHIFQWTFMPKRTVSLL
jgi:hypothetical protein